MTHEPHPAEADEQPRRITEFDNAIRNADGHILSIEERSWVPFDK